MAFKCVPLVAYAILAVLASANAGITFTSGLDNTYRNLGNLAQVSSQTKTIDTPFSSGSKSDVRASNPSIYFSAQPALSYNTHSSPIYASAGAAFYDNHRGKLAYAAAVPQSKLNYAAVPSPAYSYAAAAPAAYTEAYYPQQQHSTYQQYYPPPAHTVYPAAQQVYAAAPSAPVVTNKPTYPASTYQLAQHAPAGPYANPAAYAQVPSPAPQPALVKIAYSPANQVAHFTYSNINDHINYAW